MAGAVANLMVRAGFDGSQLQKGMQQASDNVGSFGNSLKATFSRIGEFAAAIGLERVFEKVADGIKDAVKSGIEFNASLEQSQIAWTTILGNANEAKETLKQLQVMGAKTPFEFEGLDKSAKLLENAGFQGKNLFDTLTKVGDAVSAVGGDDEALQNVSLAISQMMSKGKINAQDMNQLAERGLPVWKMLADGMHLSVAQVMKMSENGKLFAKDTLPLLIDGMGTKFKGAMDAQSQTFNGMLSTFKDDFKMIGGALTKPIFDSLKNDMVKLMPVLNGVLAATQGDFKTFTESLETAFGKETGQKIVSFTQDVSSGFSKVKDTITGIVDIFKGNQNGEAILTYVGFSPESISKLEAARDTVIDLFKGKNGLFSSFQEVFDALKSVALPILNDVIDFAKNAFSQLKSFWDQDGKNVTQAIKDEAKLIADVFKNVLAPDLQVVWDSVKTVGTVAFNAFIDTIKFLGDKMNWVMPILSGVAGAIAAYKIISTITNLIDIWRTATVLMTAAQWALDLALNANPIGLTAIAIGILIAAGVALYRNWDSISAGMSRIWSEIEQGAANMVNGVISGLNWLIQQIDKIPNVSIPQINAVHWGAPSNSLAGGGMYAYASGTNFAAGGLSLVGENGPEILDLPRGSKVYNGSQTANLPDMIASAVGTAVLQAMQFNKPQTTGGEVVLNIDGRTIAKALKPWMDQENKRVGTNVRLQSI